MNKAITGAKRKGWEACRDGKPKSANPYSDERTHTGSVTFSRAFLRAWNEGWAEGEGCDCEAPIIVSGAALKSNSCPVHGMIEPGPLIRSEPERE